MIISLLLTAAGFFGFYRSFFTIFGLTGILLTFILVLCKKRLKKLIIDCKKQLDDILNKYECQNTEEFKNGLRAYDNVIVKINLLKDELKLLDDNNKIMEFNVTESKNKANHFTIYNNDDKIESLINESEALKRSIVISEEQLEECRRASVELENLINKRSTLLHEISNARKRLNSLNISLKVLNTAFEKLKTEFAPQLAERVGDILSVITNGKYDSVLTDEDFLVKLKSEIGYNDSLYYSRGTYEQIYIAMRFALLDIAVQDRVLPIFLDDALAFLDDDRFINILNYISAESHKRQVFVSSCHSREYIYFKNKGINIIEFSSERND